MAVTNGPISRSLYIGLQADFKPVEGVEFAAQFYEYDTGKTYIWTGAEVGPPTGGQWVEYLPLYPAFFFNLTNHPET